MIQLSPAKAFGIWCAEQCTQCQQLQNVTGRRGRWSTTTKEGHETVKLQFFYLFNICKVSPHILFPHRPHSSVVPLVQTEENLELSSLWDAMKYLFTKVRLTYYLYLCLITPYHIKYKSSQQIFGKRMLSLRTLSILIYKHLLFSLN